MWDGFLRLHEAIRSRDLHLTVVGEDLRRRKQRPSTHGGARAVVIAAPSERHRIATSLDRAAVP